MLVDLRLCHCGSGLRLARCCQLDLSLMPPPEASLPLLSLVERASALHGQGDVEGAEKLCLEVLELAPTQLDALSLLYRIRKLGANQAATDALLRRIVQVHPNTVWATHDLAVMLFGRGAIAEAELHARNAVRIAPENPQSHNLLAMITTEANRPQVGEYHYRKAIELSRGRDPILLANLAWNLKNQGRMAEARQIYEESSAMAPDVLQTWLGWARMEEADRNFERAAALLDRADELEPGSPSVTLSRAVLHGRIGSYAQALATLDAAGETSNIGLGPNELLEKKRPSARSSRPP
jgi:tetratricopeptide (TPR) repeat protein